MAADPLHLPGNTHVAPDADQLYDDLAFALMAAALAGVKDRGTFHLAVSGGKSPEPFFIRLVTDPRFRAIPWRLAHLWMVDERRVPPEDERSNWKMIRETLVEHVGIKQRNAHAIPVAASDPALAYERELRQAFSEAAAPGVMPVAASLPAPVPPAPRLDFVLLGMGDDCHTASLFPGSDAVHENNRLIVANDGPRVTPPPRITMTYPLLNAARHLGVLVVGEKKTPALRRVSDQVQKAGPDPVALPITGIRPVDGDLTWFLDAAAAGEEPDVLSE